MKCYAPLRAYKTPTGLVFSELRRNGDSTQIDIPCGQCVGCRERRASDWELRIMHESKQWKENCFITLTYGRDNLPTNGSLCYRDYQLFMKKLRHHHAPSTVRFYMCGEYGPINQRPHYHACLFGIDFNDRKQAGNSESGEPYYLSETLSQLWGHGRASVQDLTHGTASYCARYILTKKLGYDSTYYAVDPDDNLIELEPERALMSLKPGIGKTFYDQYKRDIYPHDFVISKGTKRRPPKYYDKQHKKETPEQHAALQEKRETDAIPFRTENTPKRLTAQEQCHIARIRNKKRDSV